MPITRAALLAFLVSSGLAAAAHAQAPQHIVLFKAGAEDESLAELAAAIDPVLSSELNEITNVSVASRAAVDLPGMQLAIDCVGETVDCLRAAASQSEADALLAPSLRHTEDGIVVALLHFDPTQIQPIRTIERRYTGERQGEQAISGLRGMLYELFGDPAARPVQPLPGLSKPVPLAQPSAAATPRPQIERGLPVLPIVLGGVGLALLGTGTAFGLMSNASINAYKDIRTSTVAPSLARSQVDRATDKFDNARDQATVANVMFALGAGTLIGASVLMFWQLKERPTETEMSCVPNLGPREAGLTLTAAWNDSL